MKERIRKALTQQERRNVAAHGAVPAAVLMPIFTREGRDYIVFTKRTETVDAHKGQISFPGGKQEKNETLLQTALREAYEEIGLDPKVVEILGELDREKTYVSNFIISPFVGHIPYPYPFKINRREVQSLLEVPVSALLDKKNYREEIETAGDKRYRAYFFHYENEVIWGATARILKRFFDTICAAGRPQTRT